MTLGSLLISYALPMGSHAQGPAMSSGGSGPSLPWRSNRRDAKYIGSASCVKCHKEESANQLETSMGMALERVTASRVLSSHPRLSFKSGQYSYELIRKGDQSIYSVTDGLNTFSEPLAYAFGQGKAGQTYVFRHKGELYETRVSYYRDTNNLDWTLGYASQMPTSLEAAAGRALSADEARECFTCHGTAATSGKELTLDRMVPGVTCEACHGPGGDHIVAMEAKNLKAKLIFNPGKMDPDELAQEFCGSCHRSAEQVVSNKSLRGINSVRFQPYRMFTSRGHDPNDERITCTACHNPHENPRKDEEFYDSKCLNCHRSSESVKSEKVAKAQTDEGRTAKFCPVNDRLCVSCHMPKVEIPGSHFQFTDHRIRIARTGEPFPN